MLRGLASYVPFLGRFLAEEGDEEKEEDVAPLGPARIAVVGAGVGGCLAAYFLRKKGGEALQVDVFERGEVGGRVATFVFQGHVRETGAIGMHTCQKYLSDLRKEFGELPFCNFRACSTSVNVVGLCVYMCVCVWTSRMVDVKDTEFGNTNKHHRPLTQCVIARKCLPGPSEN